MGTSLLEKDQVDAVKGYLDDAAAGVTQIVLPSDIVVAPEFKADAPPTVVPADGMTEVDGLSVVGGGDSAAAVRDLGFADADFGHISTGAEPARSTWREDPAGPGRTRRGALRHGAYA